MFWDLSKGDRVHLRNTLNSQGWSIWDGALKQLEEDCREVVETADTSERWREAKGYLAAVRKVRELAEDMISVAEEGHEQWVKKRLETAMAEMEEMQALLTRDRDRVPA